jgi:hypothetical protein
MREQWEKHRNEVRKANGQWAKIIGLQEALEVAARADRRIAELELKLLLNEEA